MKPFDYEKRFKRLRNRLILLFAFAGLAVIVISNILNYRISSSIDTKEDISSLINISGRQRMLSQSITKTALLIQHEKMPQSFARDLDSLLVLFEQSHRHLLERNKFLKSKEIDDRFIQIQSSFDGLYEIGKTFLSGPSITKETSLLIEQESRFIPQMDAIVMVYEKLSFEG